MTEVHTTPAYETHHREHLLDRAAILAIRAMLALQPAAPNLVLLQAAREALDIAGEFLRRKRL
jgi:hypothetical protein